MELNRIPRRPRRLVHALLAGVAGGALALGALVVLTGGASSDRSGRVRFVPGSPAAAPGDDVAWWTPVRGEPLGIAVDGPDVAAAALDEVRLLDGAVGRTRWKAPVPGVRRYRPALAGDRVVATSETELVLLDRADGSRVATVAFGGPGPSALLSAGGRALAVAGSETGQLLAVDAADGTVRWSVTHPGEIAVAPRGVGATVLAGWEDASGSTLRAFDATTGVLRWERSLGAVAGPPVVAGDTVVVVHGDGIHSAAVHGLDPLTGAPRWLTPLPGWWDPALEPAVGADAVYLLDGMGTVVALDPTTGSLRWRRETGRPLVAGRIALTAGAVTFASYDDELMVLDRSDGRLRAVEPQRGVPVDVAADGERLVVALRLATPSRVEAHPAP